jgi:hypothetical protein
MAAKACLLRHFIGVFVLLPAILLLTACGGGGAIAPQAGESQPSRIMDPIAAFAADPPPNGQGEVFLPDSNETVRARLVRQYAAASGRECREVQLARRGGDSARLFCRAGSGWIEARPLLSQPAVR